MTNPVTPASTAANTSASSGLSGLGDMLKQLFELLKNLFGGEDKASAEGQKTADEIKQQLPAFVEEAKSLGFDLKVEGDLDTPEEMRDVAAALKEIRDSAPAGEAAELDEFILQLEKAAADLENNPVQNAEVNSVVTVANNNLIYTN